MNWSIDKADTAWLLVSTALVLLMTPALALFYGGMVKSKNVLSTFMHSFFAMALVTVQWCVVGYSLSFGPSRGGLIGGFDFAFLRGVAFGAPPNNLAVPHLVFMAYQLMFAIITPALISGAYAERMKFSAYALFTLLWSTLVYDPLAHWVWHPDGWLAKRGALDFAGGTVVHLSAGVSALVCAILVGKRSGWPRRKAPPHSLTMTMLGAGILWFGWFGFNAGSAGASNGLAALALVNTHVAAGAGALAWALVEWRRLGKPSALGVASGLVAGLVAITPAAGFVGPMPALAIGGVAGVACYAGVLLKNRFLYDDSLDAFGVHGVGGLVGALLTGVFAHVVWNPAGATGLAFGQTKLIVEQVIACGASAVWALGVTFGLLKVIDKLVGLRVQPEAEHEGLDAALHGEEGYAFGDALGGRTLDAQARTEEPAEAIVNDPAEAT